MTPYDRKLAKQPKTGLIGGVQLRSAAVGFNTNTQNQIQAKTYIITGYFHKLIMELRT